MKHPNSSLRLDFILLLIGLWLAVPHEAHAIMFYDSGSASYNNTAPTGAYANSGWQYEGYFGSFLGTKIAPSYFITAQHIGVNSNTFSDLVTSTTYNVDTNANGGVGYYDIAGTDLRVYHITGGTFPTYATIYSGTAASTAAFVDIGRGGPRGAAVITGMIQNGWLDGASDGVVRWGSNTFNGTTSVSGVGTMLVSNFTGPGADDLSDGDSGGGAFIKVGSVWELVGINYGIEGLFSASSTGSSPFNAALYNKAGLYEQRGNGWGPASVGSSSFYVSQVSSNAASINNISAVPEPCGALLVFAVGMICLIKRSRTHR